MYWLTAIGQRCQKQLRQQSGLQRLQYDFPVADWNLYGWICYRHRSSVVRALIEPMQPAAIKRQATSRDSNLRMSANNVRDIIRPFLHKGIVQPIAQRRRAHRQYELTEAGRKLQLLLNRAVIPRC